MHSTDAFAFEFSLDLTTQELLTQPSTATAIVIEDIRDIEPLFQGRAPAANTELARIEESASAVEIELTAEQVLALLGGGGAARK